MKWTSNNRKSKITGSWENTKQKWSNYASSAPHSQGCNAVFKMVTYTWWKCTICRYEARPALSLHVLLFSLLMNLCHTDTFTVTSQKTSTQFRKECMKVFITIKFGELKTYCFVKGSSPHSEAHFLNVCELPLRSSQTRLDYCNVRSVDISFGHR